MIIIKLIDYLLKILVITLSVILFVGMLVMFIATPTKETVKLEKNYDRFIYLNDNYSMKTPTGDLDFVIYYDKETKIVYKRIKGTSTSDGSPLIGQNKLPMTIDEYNADKK